MTDLSKVVFCIGSPEGKRAYFRKNVGEDFVYADNDEVFACITENGKTYFIIGKPPCCGMTAPEYVRYNRSIVSTEHFAFGALRKFVWKTCRTVMFQSAGVANLSVFAYRAVQCFTLITDKTRSVAVNFDGTPFSKENLRMIGRFLGYLSGKYKVFVSVTDARFLPDNCLVRRYLPDGEFTELSLKAKSNVIRNKRSARQYALKRGIGLRAKDIEKVVVSV